MKTERYLRAVQDEAAVRRHSPGGARAAFEQLAAGIETGSAMIGIIGLGYVGLPLALAFSGAGMRTLGFDVNREKVERLNRGEMYIRHLAGDALTAALEAATFSATPAIGDLAAADVILICVPTPIDHHRTPDMGHVIGAVDAVASILRPGQLIVLVSTTYPGTTEGLVAERLSRTGLTIGRDVFLAYAPEREDPGNENFTITDVPKVVGGFDEASRELATALFRRIVSNVVPVANPRTAEAVKLTENIFRAVNIALVNELKQIYAHMDIDVWDVIEAAKSKPFGYMPFYPGPGLGGHCIPVDPFYLAWKAKEYEAPARFIELAGEINVAMPRYVVEVLAKALGRRTGRSIHGSRILLLGIAYKKNVDDTRESLAFKLMKLLRERGAALDFADPHVPAIPRMREHGEFAGWRGVDLATTVLEEYDAALICTDHDAFDYARIARESRLVVDTRNALARTGLKGDHIVKA